MLITDYPGRFQVHDSDVKPLLQKITKGNPFLSAAAMGATPGEIKASIIAKLSPFISDSAVLNSLAIELLAPEAVRLDLVQQDAWGFSVFEQVLDVLNRSKKSDPSRCFAAFGAWHADVFHGLSGFWSLHQLEERVQHAQLNFEDGVFEYFRNIGVLLERGLQPLVRELLDHVRILTSKVSAKPVREMDFGQVVSELIDSALIMGTAWELPPFGVRISQWRNVAQHQSFVVNDHQIDVTYGKFPKQTNVSLNQNDLRSLYLQVAALFNALHAARAMFAFDNVTDVANSVGSVPIRSEAHVVQLATSFATQGFELISFSDAQDVVEAELRDIGGGDRIGRASHASQFGYPIWRCFPRPHVRIRLHPADDTIQAVFTMNGEDFEAFQNGRCEFAELANRFKVEFEDA